MQSEYYICSLSNRSERESAKLVRSRIIVERRKRGKKSLKKSIVCKNIECKLTVYSQVESEK